MSYPSAPAIVNPDVILAEALEPLGLPMLSVTPNPRPDESGQAWIRITANGGGVLAGVVPNPTATAEFWAPTQEEARDVANLGWQLVKNMRGTTVGGVAIGRVSCSLPRFVPDTVAAAPRYDITPMFLAHGHS